MAARTFVALNLCIYSKTAHALQGVANSTMKVGMRCCTQKRGPRSMVALPRLRLWVKDSRTSRSIVRVLVGNQQRAGWIWSPAPVEADICAGSGQKYFYEWATCSLIT